MISTISNPGKRNRFSISTLVRTSFRHPNARQHAARQNSLPGKEVVNEFCLCTKSFDGSILGDSSRSRQPSLVHPPDPLRVGLHSRSASRAPAAISDLLPEVPQRKIHLKSIGFLHSASLINRPTSDVSFASFRGLDLFYE
jgi:hypothetical protein